MIEVKFFRQEILDAKKWAEDRLASKDGLKSQRVCVSQSEIVGRLGELAFKKYLDHRKETYKFNNDASHERFSGDTYDFVVGGLKIDVKSSYHYKTIVVNERQKQKCQSVDVLVGVYFKLDDGRADLNTAYLIGHASPKDVAVDPFKVYHDGKALYDVPIDKLTPFKEDGIKIE